MKTDNFIEVCLCITSKDHLVSKKLFLLRTHKAKNYRGGDKSLARPGRKQATATEDFDVHIYPIYNHNLRNINTIHIYIYI